MKYIALTSALLLTLGLSSLAQPGSTNEPPAQRERISDKEVVDTYNKFPDPNGNNQDLTATPYETESREAVNDDTFIRYEEDNEANDGVPYRPTLRVIEEAEVDE